MMDLGPVNLRNPVNRRHPLARGLVAWWLTLPGWYGGRQWYDLCGLHHGTLSGMTDANGGWSRWAVPGSFGAMRFDGSNDHVEVPHATPLAITGDITMIATVRPTAFNGGNFIVSKGSASGWAGSVPELYFSFDSPPRFRATRGNATSSESGLNSVTAPSAGSVCRVAFTTSGTQWRIYINGRLDNSATVSQNVVDSGSPLYMGRTNFSTASSWRYNGQLDSLMIYNRAMSAAEIATDYRLSQRGYPGLLNRLAVPPFAGSSVTPSILPWTLRQASGVLGGGVT